MRMVRVTIEYDMDDPDKPISEELWDWINGRVTLMDIIECNDGDPSCASIREIG